MPSFLEITADKLNRIIGRANLPMIIDVRDGKGRIVWTTLGLTLYDAVYRWSREATAESHNWPNPRKG
jgi:hypothetical protein